MDPIIRFCAIETCGKRIARERLDLNPRMRSTALRRWGHRGRCLDDGRCHGTSETNDWIRTGTLACHSQGLGNRMKSEIGQENMERAQRPPSRLYKYRDLSARTLDMVVGDKLHFADPSTFNDPLDSRPSVEDDVDTDELKRIFGILIEKTHQC